MCLCHIPHTTAKKKLAMDMRRNLLCMYNFLIKTYITHTKQGERERKRWKCSACKWSAECYVSYGANLKYFPTVFQRRNSYKFDSATVHDDHCTIFHHIVRLSVSLHLSIALFVLFSASIAFGTADDQLIHCFN